MSIHILYLCLPQVSIHLYVCNCVNGEVQCQRIEHHIANYETIFQLFFIGGFFLVVIHVCRFSHATVLFKNTVESIIIITADELWICSPLQKLDFIGYSEDPALPWLRLILVSLS